MPLLGNRNKARPDKDDEGDDPKVKQKKPPRPAREFSVSDFVYRKRLSELKKSNKQHSDVDLLQALLDTVNGLIPVAEENYHEYPFHTNAAACNHLFSQQREILNDLRSLEDFSQRGTKITEFVANKYRGVFQAMVADLLNLEKALQLNTAQKAALADFKKDQATRFNEAKGAVDTHVIKLLQMK
jgi:hypothetical protein